MRTNLTFIWANDHENRATLFQYDPIPNNMPIPRVGETVYLNDAKNNKDSDDQKKYAYNPMIVAEVEWSVGADHYSVEIVLRDPNPVEWAEGAFKFYPEYDYDHKGGYTVSGTFKSHRLPTELTKAEDNAV
jgi:hypothetical protein